MRMSGRLLPRRFPATHNRHTMDAGFLFALAVASLAAAVYTHTHLSAFVRGTSRTLWLRLFLATLGIAIGLGLMAVPGDDSPVLAFCLGFGLAHVPPALVLMLKGLRGEGRS